MRIGGFQVRGGFSAIVGCLGSPGEEICCCKGNLSGSQHFACYCEVGLKDKYDSTVAREHPLLHIPPQGESWLTGDTVRFKNQVFFRRLSSGRASASESRHSCPPEHWEIPSRNLRGFGTNRRNSMGIPMEFNRNGGMGRGNSEFLIFSWASRKLGLECFGVIWVLKRLARKSRPIIQDEWCFGF